MLAALYSLLYHEKDLPLRFGILGNCSERRSAMAAMPALSKFTLPYVHSTQFITSATMTFVSLWCSSLWRRKWRREWRG